MKENYWFKIKTNILNNIEDKDKDTIDNKHLYYKTTVVQLFDDFKKESYLYDNGINGQNSNKYNKFKILVNNYIHNTKFKHEESPTMDIDESI